MKISMRSGFFIRSVLTAGIVWVFLILITLFFHIWSCQASPSFFSVMCDKQNKIFIIMNFVGLAQRRPPQHRCSIPLALDPANVVIPRRDSLHGIVKNLSYVVEDERSREDPSVVPLFGGGQNWVQREQSFQVKQSMKIHCGFTRNGGGVMRRHDIQYTGRCEMIVASGIFDGYDVPHEPSNVSPRSRDLFCFLMVVDEVSLRLIKKKNATVERDGGTWVGSWRLVLLMSSPYDEPRRNGKVPKILTHRLFPRVRYSIWIDGKMELVVDPLLILERYLWRGNHTFAIAAHKHHRSVYEEADAVKRRKRYARPLVDLQMRVYAHEGMLPWGTRTSTGRSDVPEGAIVVREHTPINNLFSCLWFNEVDMFTPRDQLSFGYVAHRLGRGFFRYFMFDNCEYNSLFVLHPHTREHSSPVEWVKHLHEFRINSGNDSNGSSNNNGSLRETRGGMGFWTAYPVDLTRVVVPSVTPTSRS